MFQMLERLLLCSFFTMTLEIRDIILLNKTKQCSSYESGKKQISVTEIFVRNIPHQIQVNLIKRNIYLEEIRE